MPRGIKRPLLLASQRTAARDALKVLEGLSPAHAKTVREYLEAEEAFERQLIASLTNEMDSCEQMRAEIKARKAFDGSLRNAFGRPPSSFSFRDFYRMRRGEDDRYHGYCSMCGAEVVDTKDGDGRSVRMSVDCKHDCPGVVLGYWESHNEVD